MHSGLNLTQLTLPGRRSVTDSGLSFLSRLSLLTELDLTDYTQVTDQGVAHLASMTRSSPNSFELLLFPYNRTIDRQIVRSLRRLKKLSLSNTQVTDAGLPPLRSLQELQDLCLDRTAVTSQGAANLITRLPHLQVSSREVPRHRLDRDKQFIIRNILENFQNNGKLY